MQFNLNEFFYNFIPGAAFLLYWITNIQPLLIYIKQSLFPLVYVGNLPNYDPSIMVAVIFISAALGLGLILHGVARLVKQLSHKRRWWVIMDIIILAILLLAAIHSLCSWVWLLMTIFFVVLVWYTYPSITYDNQEKVNDDKKEEEKPDYKECSNTLWLYDKQALPNYFNDRTAIWSSSIVGCVVSLILVITGLLKNQIPMIIFFTGLFVLLYMMDSRKREKISKDLYYTLKTELRTGNLKGLQGEK